MLIFIGITLVLQSFQGEKEVTPSDLDDFVISTDDNKYTLGDNVIVEVKNNLDHTVRLASGCPAAPLLVEKYINGVWERQIADEGLFLECVDESDKEDLIAEKIFYTQQNDFVFLPNSSYLIEYSPWKEELFSSLGQYRITLSMDVDDVAKSFSTEFEFSERGFFSSVTYNLFFRPIFNFLLYLTSILPGYNFGLAVILLTVIIRLLLLAPNHKALKSQRAMMKIQPEIEEIKRRHKGDQQKISKETMALWKKHKVSPVGGCLPLLMQLPILIALFYVVKIGFSPYQSHIIYEFLSSVSLADVNPNFFGILDLRLVNITWLPISVGLLQFFQMKLSFSRKKVRAEIGALGEEVIEITDPNDKNKKKKKDKKPAGSANPMKMMNKTMLYFMPLMIAFMVASTPAGVGLYLAVSSVFGIGQQYFINKSV